MQMMLPWHRNFAILTKNNLSSPRHFISDRIQNMKPSKLSPSAQSNASKVVPQPPAIPAAVIQSPVIQNPVIQNPVIQSPATQAQLFESMKSAVKSMEQAHMLPPSPKTHSTVSGAHNISTLPSISTLSSAGSAAQASIAMIDLSASHPTSEAATQLDIAMRRFSGMTLLEWCVRRLSESTLLDNTIVTGLPSYQPQVQAAGLCDARWMPSLESESIDRISQIAERTNATWIAVIRPNCPFFDAALLDRLLASAWSRPDADFVNYISLKRNNIDWNRFGLGCEIVHRRMLQTTKANKIDLRRGISGIIKSYPNLFQSHSIPLPEQLDQANLHFALETAEDWDHAYNYLEAVGDDSSWQRLVETSLMLG
jgi:spore coat polysaccharide biosynthesis protein SpsF (cytidylyltransferase family)